MPDKISEKDPLDDLLDPEDEDFEEDEEEEEEPPDDPYLNELDSSIEDLLEEESSSAEVEEPQQEEAPAPVEETPPEPKAAAAEPIPEQVESGIGVVADIPVQLRIVVGDKQTTLADLLNMKKGEIMELDKGLDAAVDLVVQDKVIARGELVEVEGRLGVRVVRVLSKPESD